MRIRVSSNSLISVLAYAIPVLNVIALNNNTLGNGLILFQSVILIAVFIFGSVSSYLCTLIVFGASALMNTDIMDAFYNTIVENNIFGIPIIAVFSLIGLLKVLLQGRSISLNGIKNNSRVAYSVMIAMNAIGIASVIVGIIVYSLNDNGVQNIQGGISNLFRLSYYTILIPISFSFMISNSSSCNEEFSKQITKCLKNILIGVCLSAFIARGIGAFGYYGGFSNYVNISPVSWYIPLLLLDQKKDRIIGRGERFIVIATIVFLLISNASGKLIIITAYSVFYLLTFSDSISSYLKPVLGLVTLTIAIIMLSIIGVGNNSSSSLLGIKMGQVISLVNIFNANWLSNMEGSPKIRVYEIINTAIEFVRKPYYILFGKGIYGTIQDYTEAFGRVNTSAFSAQQYAANAFYGVHETFAKLFLYNGAAGIIFFIDVCKKCIKRFSDNIWIQIGFFWFIFSYGWNIQQACFGYTALIIGLLISGKSTELKRVEE